MLDDFRKKNGIMQTTLATSNPASVVVDDLPNIDTCSLAAEESYKQLRNVYYRHAHLRQNQVVSTLMCKLYSVGRKN